MLDEDLVGHHELALPILCKEIDVWQVFKELFKLLRAMQLLKERLFDSGWIHDGIRRIVQEPCFWGIADNLQAIA